MKRFNLGRYINVQVSMDKSRLYFEFGWCPGENFVLVKLSLFEVIDEDMFAICNIHIAHLIFGFGIEKGE